MRLLSFGIAVVMFLFFIFIPLGSKVSAATLVSSKDTITTSRPSASTPLSANAASGDATATVFDNGSRFLASDSAKIIRSSTAAIVDAATIVASQSSALTTVFFAETVGNAAQAGTDVLYNPITAMHTIQFTVVNGITTNGDIILTFPTLTAGDADNDASPSATTFQFNNLVTGTGGRDYIDVFDDAADISANITITETEPGSGTPGVLSLNLDSGTIDPGSVITIYLGCTASTSSSCSTQSPRIINPTKTAAAGTADRWKLTIQTQTSGGIELDRATVAIATIESVQVLATVDPTLTFTITGLNNNVAWSTGNAGCSAIETTNSGIASTSTVVNLGVLNNTPSAIDTKIGNIAGQRVNITTNGFGGYALSATASGKLRNLASGFDIQSSTTPTAFPSDDPWFGVHPCGLDVTTATWNSSASQTCNTYITGSSNPVCLYAWPTSTSSVTLASDATGPIGVNAGSDGNGVVSLAYAGGVDPSVPAGIYQTIITYIATATF